MPTLFLFGSFEPEPGLPVVVRPQAFLIKMLAGGDFITKQPPASSMIKKALKLASGSKEPNKNKVGKLTWDQIRAIAKEKMPDMNAAELEAASRSIAGTARSMGVDVG